MSAMSLPTAFNRFRDQIETEIKSLVLEEGFPLYRMMGYHMGWLDEYGEAAEGESGKRIRPTLSLLACEALGGDVKVALPAAAAVELVHNFSLIHDDIQDGNSERHNRPTVWWVWGPAQAINAGDGMHALARLALLRQTGEGMSPERTLKAVGLLDQACLRLCEGQYLDLTYQERVDISQDAYFKMVEGKTAALISCAAELGAVMSSVEEPVERAIAQFGAKLGTAFQIRDDILDLWGQQDTGKPLAGDILNKKKSLPIVYAIENASGAERRTLGDVYFKRVMEPEDIDKIIEVLETLGAREFCQAKADALCDEAVQSLKDAGLTSQQTEGLEAVARFIVTRDS
jgi:geranylgeranyl diphosphate synthase type I